jgi:hypothetical protein
MRALPCARINMQSIFIRSSAGNKVTINKIEIHKTLINPLINMDY